MENKKIETYIGFAVKSGKVIWGLDMLKKSKILPHIIVYDAGLGQNSLKQLKLFSMRNNLPILELPQNYLNKMLCRENIKIISILDSNLGKAIIENIN